MDLVDGLAGRCMGRCMAWCMGGAWVVPGWCLGGAWVHGVVHGMVHDLFTKKAKMGFMQIIICPII